MPELAEVEIFRRNIEKWWSGRRSVETILRDEKLLRGEIGNWDRLWSQPIVSVARRGKTVLVYTDGPVFSFHFRMTGQVVLQDSPDHRFGRLAWRVEDQGWLIFVDPRRLGHVDFYGSREEQERDQRFARMGPEPYDLNPTELLTRLHRSPRRLLKSALLDQHVLAGVGNIAISEVFFVLRWAPDLRCGDLDADQVRKLVDYLPIYFDDLIARQDAEIIEFVTDGGPNPFSVYRRLGEPCSMCSTPIVKTQISSRVTYFCSRCQSH